MEQNSKNPNQKSIPLMSWDVYAMQKAEYKVLNKLKIDENTLLSYQEAFNWKTDLSKILNNPYEALVLTDESVKIAWVSEGFFKMTGYSYEEVEGKSPKILQGKNTSLASRQRLKENLYGQNAFTEDLINYRKNGEEYICRVEIHPLFSHDHKLTHFLALEKEVY